MSDDLRLVMRAVVREELKDMLGAEARIIGEYLRDELDRRQRRRELWERVRQSVLGWFVIAVLSGLGAAVWLWTKHQISKG